MASGPAKSNKSSSSSHVMSTCASAKISVYTMAERRLASQDSAGEQ
jgi:hypothetical protein